MKGLFFFKTTEKEGHKKWILCKSVTTALDNDDCAYVILLSNSALLFRQNIR